MHVLAADRGIVPYGTVLYPESSYLTLPYLTTVRHTSLRVVGSRHSFDNLLSLSRMAICVALAILEDR